MPYLTKKYFQYSAAIWVALLLSIHAAIAQPASKVLDLDELVVTGQYEVNSLSKSVHKVKVIDAKRIEAQGAFSLQQVLGNELNIRIMQDPILGTSMQLQGVGGNNIKVLIDGVPVIGRENGNIDLSQINLQNVERIEFVEGPMSVNYGTDALGGVINIITKKQKQATKNFKLGTYAESIGQYNIDLSGGVANEKYSILVNSGRNYFGGYSEDPESRNKLWKPRTQYMGDISIAKFINKGSIRWTNQIFTEKVSDKGVPNIDWTQAVAMDRYYITTRYSSSFFYEKKLDGKRNINFLASYNYYQRTYNTYLTDLVGQTKELVPSNFENDTNYFHQVMSRGTYANLAFSKKMNYQLGYEINHEFSIGSRIEGGNQNMGDYNVFLSAEVKPLPRLFIRPALRAIYHTNYNAPLVPSINIKYDITGAFTLRGSYARGFRAPNLKELYLQFVDASHNLKGNPDLVAEISNNYQLGATYNYKLENSRVFRFEPGIFYNHIMNMIDLARVGTGTNASFQYVNINTFSSVGMAVGIEYRTIPYQLSLGYSYMGRKNHLNGYAETSDFYFSNEWRINASFNFQKIGWSLNLFSKLNGKLQMYQYDYLNNNVTLSFIDPFALIDLTIGKTFLNKKLSLTAGVKNILDVVNVNASINSGPHSSGSNSSSAGTGRSLFIGLRYSF